MRDAEQYRNSDDVAIQQITYLEVSDNGLIDEWTEILIWAIPRNSSMNGQTSEYNFGSGRFVIDICGGAHRVKLELDALDEHRHPPKLKLSRKQ